MSDAKNGDSVGSRLIALFEHLLNPINELHMQIGDDLDRINSWLNEIKEALENQGHSPLPPAQVIEALTDILKKCAAEPPRRGRRGAQTEAERILKRAAEIGVTNFELHPSADGSAKAVIDGTELSLSVTLAKLLALLADPDIGSLPYDAPPVVADFVPFKSFEELRRRMENELRRPFTDNTLRNLISRLRKEFRMAQLNPFFIQTAAGGQKAARLAFRRNRPDAGS